MTEFFREKLSRLTESLGLSLTEQQLLQFYQYYQILAVSYTHLDVYKRQGQSPGLLKPGKKMKRKSQKTKLQRKSRWQ